MSQADFQSAFRNLLHEPLPPAPDPRRVAFELFRRDQKRTHLLAVLSLLFWVLGTAGIFLLVFTLNRMVMDARLHSYSESRPSAPATQPGGAGGMSVDRLIHTDLPPIAFTKICAVVEASVVALLIAALLTVALVFSSRQATLNRINLSLMQISEQLMQSRQGPPGDAAPGGAASSWYSLPPAGTGAVSSVLIRLLLALVLLLLLGVPALWLGARATAAREARRAAIEARDALRPWHGYPRLSPFEGVQWKDTRPNVQVRGKWYELVSMDGLSAAQIIAQCRAMDSRNWQKRFEEDLVEVLARTGHPIGDRTMLEVKDLETGQLGVLPDVPLTRENRDALWRAASTRPTDAP